MFKIAETMYWFSFKKMSISTYAGTQSGTSITSCVIAAQENFLEIHSTGHCSVSFLFPAVWTWDRKLLQKVNIFAGIEWMVVSLRPLGATVSKVFHLFLLVVNTIEHLEDESHNREKTFRIEILIKTQAELKSFAFTV